MRKSCRGDPEVVTSDYFAPRGASGPNLRVHTRDGLRDRNGLELRKQMLNVSAASRPSGTAGAMNPMQQLAHRDHADRPLFVADDFIDHSTRALTGDEQVGIDQDGQGLSGGPISARIARRSSAKSGSSGGAASRSSRNCAALTEPDPRGRDHRDGRPGPGEVVVSSTVKDLVAGSGIAFRDRGAAELKGVPGEWRLFAVESG